MNITETILRICATFMNFTPPVFLYYLRNYVAVAKPFVYYVENVVEKNVVESVGQDVVMQVLLLKLMLPLQRLIHLVGLLCLPLFFYEIVQLYKGIKRKTYSRAYILEISLLLFVVAINAFDALGFWLSKYAFSMQVSFMRKIIVNLANFFKATSDPFTFIFKSDKSDILVAALILHYALWLYRIFIARKTHSAQSVHE